MKVTAAYVATDKTSDEQLQEAEKYIDKTEELLDDSIERGREIIRSRTIAGGIAKASRSHDMVMIGAAKEPFFRKMLFGEIPEKVARYSPTSVLVVKKYEGVVKNVLKKVLG